MAGARTRYDGIDSLEELIERSGTAYARLSNCGDLVLNSRGLRTIESATEQAPSALRVAVPGDAHTWASGGMPFGDLWHSRLAARLDDAFVQREERITSACRPSAPTSSCACGSSRAGASRPTSSSSPSRSATTSCSRRARSTGSRGAASWRGSRATPRL
jgi:hypothetical protein